MAIVISQIPDVYGASPSLAAFIRAVKTRLTGAQPVKLPVYTTEQLNAETARLHEGKIVRCSNGNAGSECLAYCDGLNWKIIELGGDISSS
jgi:hypothetical protein